MSETFVRGVIRNVPTGDAEEDLLELLSDQAVTKLHWFWTTSPDGARTPLRTVVLYFNKQTIPREVIIAHEVFPVHPYIPRPALCRICWIFGHPEETCKNQPI